MPLRFLAFLEQIPYPEIHILRMFGSYVLIFRGEAVYATPSPIRYCPLMYKLLKEVGGPAASRLLEDFRMEREIESREGLLRLINEIILSQGAYRPDRPLNVCEANVSFGASEIMMDALSGHMIDAAALVMNGMGSVLTFTPGTTQGVVQRMTGCFFTTPHSLLLDRCLEEGVYPVFPFTGSIDPLASAREALRLGIRRFAVTTAASYNSRLDEIACLENSGSVIYRLALCATAVDRPTAAKMSDHGDIVWSCASSHVREVVAPRAIAQVGLKIPVYIMTQRGFELIKPRLKAIDPQFDAETVIPVTGGRRPVICHRGNRLEMIPADQIRDSCSDCPSPLI
ncbi:MAG TPA: hypothetical protein DD727_00105 [Clostridiales bacterium]|nr:hypothetical protein [Clostridiales bacterium]